MKILIFAGTKNGRELVEKLAGFDYEIFVFYSMKKVNPSLFVFYADITGITIQNATKNLEKNQV